MPKKINKKINKKVEAQKQMLGALATTVYVLTSVQEAEANINLQDAIQLAIFQMDGIVAILGDEVSKQVIEAAARKSMPPEEVEAVSEQA